MSMQPHSYGEVHGPRVGEMSRRSFMRRMLGVGVGILSLEFLAGSASFLWPNVRGGLGGRINIGTATDIVASEPEWVRGLPYAYQPARVFLVNVPAGKALVDGTGEAVEDPGDQVLALYRKCPHLGCQIPQLCDASKWFECLCHGSKYTILGEKRDGPAPRGMDSFAVEVVDGVYVIDTSAIIDGPPIGTEEFDSRTPTEMSHCAG
jgi:cytochrome b6-f complex iron-sulfur subunit